jgi:arabinofuranosyltransferase
MQTKIINRIQRYLLIIFSFLDFAFIVHRAWLLDDSYITFRTVENLINGYGLTWNTFERVQTYTHPLWMLMLAAVDYFSRNIYLTSLVLSLIFVGLAIFIFAYKTDNNNKYGALLGIILLGFSNAFIDYGTSGLENPLSYFLFAIFFFVLIKYQNDKYRFFLLNFITSLIAITRMDLLLIVLPVLVYVFFKERNDSKKWLWLIVGQLPFILWELFSLFYYGFPFPNTYYAKLFSGYPLDEYLIRGVNYYKDILSRDTVTIIGLILGLFAGFISRKPKLILSTVGLVLYLLYVIYIGGDFMMGRMVAVPLFVAAILISQIDLKMNQSLWLAIPPLALIFLGFFTPIPTPFLNGNVPITQTIYQFSDERRYYYEVTGLFHDGKIHSELDFSHVDVQYGAQLAESGIEANKESQTANYVTSLESIGFYGYYAGAIPRLIDLMGLTDPLLARLPGLRGGEYGVWRTGHVIRNLPDGYYQTIKYQEDLLVDTNLREYYKHLHFIISGPLFSMDRLKEIVLFNLGKYNYLINVNEYKYQEMTVVNSSDIFCQTGSTSTLLELPTKGWIISLSDKTPINNLQLKLEKNAGYSFILLDEKGNEVYKQQIDWDIYSNAFADYSIHIPEDIQKQKIAKILFWPYSWTEKSFSVGCFNNN